MKTDLSQNYPERIAVWPAGNIPVASAEDAGLPSMTLYRPSPEYWTGQAVLVLPGGGYHWVSSAKEGHRPAQFLNAHGIAAAVLEYRHSPARHPVPLLDAQRGMRLLRKAVQGWGGSESSVGVLGFSAGGHLAGTLATEPPVVEGEVDELGKSFSCHPDFMALIYPVVSFVSWQGHSGSCRNLLGPSPGDALRERLSIELAINENAPPTFINHAQDDQTVSISHSLGLAQRLVELDVPVEVFTTPEGGHGYGLGKNLEWGQVLLRWMGSLLAR